MAGNCARRGAAAAADLKVDVLKKKLPAEAARELD